VFCWTLRAENAFLPPNLRVGTSPGDLGNALAEARHLLALGVDGLITDSPDYAVRAIKALSPNDHGALTTSDCPGVVTAPGSRRVSRSDR
jgi:glycerophosphoryl diester phosphodiesterase